VATFDKEADVYDQWYQTQMGAFVDRVETSLALEMIRVQPGMHVLDAGCGTGNFSIKLKELGARVTGVDISREMLRIATEKSTQKQMSIDFFEMDLGSLDFRDETFDAVISMAALEFIEEHETVMEEMYRVLKPGGQLLIGTINRDSAWGELYMSDAYQKNTIFRHATLKSLADLTAWRPGNLVNTGSCLYIPPDAAESDFTDEKEAAAKGEVNGGFICAKWKK
jgi:ubiquinone/menaquinone biosynthesis C-methylase UbiE